MKNRPIHQNLDTSFVNLSALIKYLRRRQFVGNIKVQLNGYMADINVLEDNQMNVNEHDQISGRVSHGEEALQRLLIRAREPGGSINVYQFVAESEEKIVEQKTEKTPVKKEVLPIVEADIVQPIPKPMKTPNRSNGYSTNEIPKITESIPNSKPKGTKESVNNETPNPRGQEPSLPNFPFRLSNKVEAKARNNEISNEDWQTLLKLTVEILIVIDKSLAQSNLDFSAAFRKARAEIADDYPFLNPDSEKFDYQQGKVKMTEKMNPKIFIASITEAVRRILNKLEANPKFESTHKRTVQTLSNLYTKRKPLHDKFGITQQLKRVLGI